MKYTTTIFLLLAALLLPLFAAASESNASGMAARITSASALQTTLSVTFDEAAVAGQIASGDVAGRRLDGYGTVLAINGYGTPAAHVTGFTLGDAVPGSFSLDALEIPSSPDELVTVGTPVILHELRIVTVNYQPVMRDASGTARVVRTMDVAVTTAGAGGENTIANPVSFSQAWYPVYQSVAANLDDMYPEIGTRPPGRFLIISTDYTFSVLGSRLQCQNWVDLKKRKGYQVQFAPFAVIRQAVGDTTKEAIRQYISQTYHDASLPDLEYAVLIGDVTGVMAIPTWYMANPELPTELKAGDNEYFEIEGNDYIPDILHGRISVNTSDETAAYLNKEYQYEVNPYRDDPHWFESGTFVAGNFNDGSGTYPVTPVWNVSWARDRFLHEGCITEADTFYYHNYLDPPPGQYRVLEDINQGVCMVLYRGWAAQPGWQYPRFNNTDDVSRMNVGRRNPAVFGIVCGSGDFAWGSGQCLGENMTFVTGSVSQPNGSIMFYGATDVHTNTRHNNAILAGIVEATLVAGLRSAGGLDLAGKLEGYRQFPNDRQIGGPVHYYIFHVFNLLGDPETPLYICQPHDLDVTYPASVPSGQTLMDVTVQSQGLALPQAVVTARANDSAPVYSVVTDQSGHAYVPLNLDTSPDSVQLTVWKGQHFLKRIKIAKSAPGVNPKITAVNWTGGDNLPNPGETAPFTLTVEFRGVAQTALSLIVASTDSRITVGAANANLGPVTPGQIVTTTSLSIVLGALMDGERPKLNVTFNGTENALRTIEVPVAAPYPLMRSYLVNDGNDNILDPGETATITVDALNIGHQAATNLTAVVSSWDNSVIFPDNQAGWSSLPIGQAAVCDNPFQVTLANGVTPGRQILLRFEVHHNGVIVGPSYLVIVAGHVTPSAPTGPDAYGYYAYENNDVGPPSAVPTYQWIELDPAVGGDGIPHDVHDDTQFTMALPAQFNYYGQNYSNVWICSNGWFSFEPAPIPEFRNWELPSPIGPPSLVCPFWDDLVGKRAGPVADTLFHVWTRYDPTESRFTMEWRAFNRRRLPDSPGVPNVDSCFFEATLEFNTNSILFQYQAISNIDNDANYATVGMEDSQHERGLNLTYANHYPASMDSLRPRRAIRITTTPPDAFLAADNPRLSTLPKVFALRDAYPNPFNPATQIGFDLPTSTQVTIEIFNTLGQRVATLVNGVRPAGSYHVPWNAEHAASGIYICQIKAGSFVQAKKMVLMH